MTAKPKASVESVCLVVAEVVVVAVVVEVASRNDVVVAEVVRNVVVVVVEVVVKGVGSFVEKNVPGMSEVMHVDVVSVVVVGDLVIVDMFVVSAVDNVQVDFVGEGKNVVANDVFEDVDSFQPQGFQTDFVKSNNSGGMVDRHCQRVEKQIAVSRWRHNFVFGKIKIAV